MILRCLSLLSLLCLASCGAGIVTGAVLSGNGSRRPPPEVRPPELSMPEQSGPLVPPIDVVPFRTVVISDYQVQGSSNLRIEIRALGVVSVQTSPLVLSSSTGASVLGFILQNSEIVAKIPNLTAADVEARLAVLVNDLEIAPPIPFLLRKQPRSSLVPPAGQTNAFLSVLGGTKLSVRVNYLVGTTPDDVQIQVGVTDPAGTIRIQRCTDLTITLVGEGPEVIVTGSTPTSPYAGSVYVSVVDSRAGSSTLVPGVYYRAALDVVSPRTSPTEGGVVVTLAGTGLVPYDLSKKPATLDFKAVSVLLRRGGREVTVPAVSMRPDLSSLSRLVFTVPPSPDGRAGPAEVALRADFGQGVVGETAVPNLFVYGYSTPVFGPRGTVLPEAPTRIAFAPIEGSPLNQDLAMLSSFGGLPRVFLFATSGNGLFTRLGAPFDGGVLADPAQRIPADLLATDLDGDGRRDLFVLNRGNTQSAVHGLLLTKPKPAAPLAFLGGVLATPPGPRRVVKGDFDEDGLHDLLTIPDPQVFLTRLSGPPNARTPTFVNVDLSSLAPGPFDAALVADLDGDQHADLVFVAGGLAPRLAIVYGDGRGGFVAGQQTALQIPGYTGASDAAAIGIHACGTPPRLSLAVVLAGRAADPATRPSVAVLAPATTTRLYDQPTAAAVFAVSAADEPFAASTAADLDGNGPVELLVAHGGMPRTPVRMLVWSAGKFLELAGAVDAGIESMRDIRQIEYDGSSVQIAHAVSVDQQEEHRVTTWIVASGPRLLAPDAARELAAPVRGIALGNFRGVSASRTDACVASTGLLRFLHNDGLGGFSPGTSVPVPGIVPGTISAAQLALPQAAQGDGLLFLTSSGKLGWLAPNAATPLVLDTDLRRFGPQSIHTREVSAESRMSAADVDGDGFRDLVLLLSCSSEGPERREGEALLLLLRGHPVASATEFPLLAPAPTVTVARVHGNASGLTVADFLQEPGRTPWLEAAVAIPSGDTGDPAAGNHLRFFRYVPGPTPEEDRLVRSFTEEGKAVLIAGDRPQEIVASDFDGNGTIDLAVASGGDERVRVYLNSGALSPSNPLEVNVGAFLESFGSPPPLPPGRPLGAFLGDLNGDGIADLVVRTLDEGAVFHTAIGIYLSNGNGGLALSSLIPQIRSGDVVNVPTGPPIPRNAKSVLAVRDVNGDETLDLVIGWETSGAGDQNLRVLFGGAR